MSALPLSVFERRLADLTREQFRDVVADLWAARGAEVTVEGGDILVSSGVRRSRLRTVHSGTPVPTALVSDSNLAMVDLVVTSADSSRLREAATAAGVGYVGPERLRKVALHAIDREQCESILQQYFGRPIEEHTYREIPARRIEWMANVIEVGSDQSDGRVVSRSRPPWPGGLKAALIVLVVLTVTIEIGAEGSLHGPCTRGQQSSQTITRRPMAPPPAYRRYLSVSMSLRQFSGTRLADLSALVAAHERAFARSDYTLEISQTHTRGVLLTTGR